MKPVVTSEAILPGAFGQISELHELVVAKGIAAFEKDGRAPFLWTILLDHHLTFIETPWENEREKMEATHKMRHIMAALQARAYSFMTEAWVSAINFESTSKEDQEKIMEQSRKHGVKSLPETLREDVLMVSTYDRGGNYLMTRFGVRYGSRTHPTGGWKFGRLLARDDWHKDSIGHFEGRMWNLLKEEGNA